MDPAAMGKKKRFFRLFKKQYIIRHQRKISAAKRVHKHPAFFVPLVTITGLLVISVAAVLVINRGNNPIPALASTDTRIAIVTADEQEQTVPTRAKTVGELLERLDITINRGDVVEPGIEAEIVSDNFRINVYRAKPVTVIDGNKKIQALSAAATPRSIAKQVGVDTFPEDIIELDPADNFVTQGAIGQRLVVTRSTPVSLNLYGTPFAMRTHANTVGEFLEEKEIELGEGETVQPSITSRLSQDTPIFVNRKGIRVETRTEEIPHDTRVVEDKNLSFGVEVLRQEGAAGRRVVTYQINKETGERTKFHTITVRKPVDEVIARGAYVNVPSDKRGVMAAAGIREGDFGYVDFIIARESGWNAAARNASSGAHGLCQALPGSKMASAGSDWATNPVTQLQWCNGYAVGRYGSWSAAYSFWQRNHWW